MVVIVVINQIRMDYGVVRDAARTLADHPSDIQNCNRWAWVLVVLSAQHETN